MQTQHDDIRRKRMIAAIQIGRKTLALDDDIYRPMLERLTGKDSTKVMTESQLGTVLEHMNKSLGFIPKPPKAKTNTKPKPRSSMTNKIRAIWITMHKQDFLENGTDRALDAYGQRMTKTTNSLGVEYIVWLDNKQAANVLESLKKWHGRLMKRALDKQCSGTPLPKSYDALSTYYENTKY